MICNPYHIFNNANAFVINSKDSRCNIMVLKKVIIYTHDIL